MTISTQAIEEFDVHADGAMESLLNSQNGTVATSLSELVCNAIDKGATQVMAMGTVVWTSGNHSMSVDVKKHGMSFSLCIFPNAVTEGGKVEGMFYDPLSDSQLFYTIEELIEQLAYIKTHIFINSEKINKDHTSVNWDIERDNFNIKWTKAGGVKLYN